MGLFDKLTRKMTRKTSAETAEEQEIIETKEKEAPAPEQEKKPEQAPTAVSEPSEEQTSASAEEKTEKLQETGTETPAEEKQLPAEEPEATVQIDIKDTLLIADSDEKSRKALTQMLGSDHKLIFAESPDETIKLLRDNKKTVSLVLIDVMMNGRKGMDILRLIKEDAALKAIPAVVFTSDRDSEIRSLGMGALDFIPKPLPDQLIVRSRVNRCAELSESRSIISTTERDSRTALLNVDYFKHYVGLFDTHYYDVSMDAIVAVISNYRLISEHYGKKFADSVLQSIGGAIRDLSQERGGYGCRSTEDTFLIYCPHTKNYDKLLSKLTAGLEKDPATTGKVRLCLGVYADVNKDITIEQRYEMANIAAKSIINSYTDRIGIYSSEMRDAAQFREQILGEFMSSLKSGRFRIFFQPKFDIRGDKPVLYSAEALVRWDHPQLGMLSPGAFIGLLEENGLITQLDRYVWGEAAAQIRRWKDEYGYSVPVSVNISHIDMLLPLLKDIFKEILKKYTLSEDDIILEITESAYDSDNDQILSAAQELRGMGMGMRIEIGNFGGNYSSIGMLSHMPIDALKIDMEFVHNSLGDKKDMRMIELIIDIADYLHVPVVAEGVETEEQYLLLKALGCDLVQGFYFSKPVPKEEFDHFIKEAGSETHIVTETKKNYVSISKALAGEYERIFYIDVNSDHYMQFYSDGSGGFRIHTGGRDFFADIDEAVLSFVVPEDKERIGRLLSKEQFMGWVNADKPFSTHFKCVDDGTGTLVTLETIRTRNQDDHHIVIGVRQNNGQITVEE